MKPRLTERSARHTALAGPPSTLANVWRKRKSVAECDPTPSDMHYVYVLKNRQTHQLYYGYTNSVK